MTTTDVDTRPPAGGVVPPGAGFAPTPSEAITSALEAWVGGMAASVRGAEFIVDTPMCPDAFWPLPPNAKSKTPKQMLAGESIEDYRERRRVASYTLGAVVRYGLQLGLPPEVAVQGIFTVGGRMSMYAEQMVALIKSRGHGHRVVERTRERCTVEVCRAGTDRWVPFTFTFEDAVAAGYVPNQGPNDKDHGRWPSGEAKKSPGNEKYLLDPATMLYARCSSIACRTEFPDVLRGLTSYEDVQDEQTSTTVAVTVEDQQPAARPRAAAILAAADAASATTVPAATQDTPAAEPEQQPVQRAVLPVSGAHLNLIKAAFEKHGLGGRAAAVRADRMRVLSSIVEREINDPRQLTDDEGRLVLDNLAGEAGRRLLADVIGWRSQEPATEPAGDLEDGGAVDEQAAGESWAPGGEDLPDPTVGGDPWATQA